MENRVYYGEYSLKHWIDLILKENIVLPEYQRYFVWNETKMKTLIDTFKKKQFVPPVTIGSFKNGEINQNLILDGQQRLTSILLAHLGLFPDEKNYKKALDKVADENDNENEEDDDEQLDNVLEWTFKLLTEKGKKKEDILKKIKDGNYKILEDLEIDEEFLKTNFLGFSYLVPDKLNAKEQQKYYSSVFRNINVQGEPLLNQESRASLYYLDKDLVRFFEPHFCKTLTVKTLSGESKIDFVRYCSLLFQYYKDKRINVIARGYKLKMEKYYEEYIYSIVGENDSKMFGNFSDVFPHNEYVSRFESLRQTIDLLQIPKQYPSIIDSDMYLFGLIYETVFDSETINNLKNNNLKDDIEKKIIEFKGNPSHSRSPSALKHLRARIESSIEIYKKYTNE